MMSHSCILHSAFPHRGDRVATTYNNLFLDTRARLKKAGIDGAQLEARELVCYAADKSREQLYRDMPLYVSAELEKRVDDLVRRRLAGEPVAYIIGEWEFYGLGLDITPDVLIPRMDTEEMCIRDRTGRGLSCLYRKFKDN